MSGDDTRLKETLPGQDLAGDLGPAGAGLPPALPPMDSVPADSTPATKARMLLTLARRQNALNIRWLYVGLVLLTVYFLVLNFFLLFEIQPRPLRLDMASSHYALDTPGAALHLTWAPLNGTEVPEDPTLVTAPPAVIRPRVMVGEQELLPDAADADGTGTSAGTSTGVPVQGPVTVEVVSPPDVTPIDHTGTLTLVLPGVTAENYPTCPIEVSYTENPWRVWFMARTWLAVAVVLFAATYLLCVILFPVPAGQLHVSGSLSTLTYAGEDTSGRPIRLRVDRLAWWFPWRRSRLSLTGVLDQGGIGSANCPPGTLWFPERGRAPILILKEERRTTLYRRRPTEDKPDPAQMDAVRALEDLGGGFEYLYLDPLTQAWISYRWSN